LDTTFIEWEGAAVASLVCALPAALFSSRPLAAVMSFAVIAMLHMIVAGLPAHFLLQWRKAASARNCVLAGVVVGAAPYALFFAPRFSSPGESHLQTILLFALSGAAVGYVFWRYLAWRRQGQFIDAMADYLPQQSSDEQLFRLLREGAGGHPFMQKVFDKAGARFAARRVEDLSVSVAADSSARNRYVLSITNHGRRTFSRLRVHYEPLLLDAESFGQDTTHMPAERARTSGEPLRIPLLQPGTTERFVRAGWGSHNRYDGPRETAMDVEYRAGGEVVTAEDRRWCRVSVDLAGAQQG